MNCQPVELPEAETPALPQSSLVPFYRDLGAVSSVLRVNTPMMSPYLLGVKALIAGCPCITGGANSWVAHGGTQEEGLLLRLCPGTPLASRQTKWKGS